MHAFQVKSNLIKFKDEKDSQRPNEAKLEFLDGWWSKLRGYGYFLKKHTVQ